VFYQFKNCWYSPLTISQYFSSHLRQRVSLD